MTTQPRGLLRKMICHEPIISHEYLMSRHEHEW